MPYTITDDLPPSVRNHLPEHAQEIFLAAFNNAWHEYGGDEVRAFRVAWAAVKQRYRKRGDRWVVK
jgi:cation transport regulator